MVFHTFAMYLLFYSEKFGEMSWEKSMSVYTSCMAGSLCNANLTFSFTWSVEKGIEIFTLLITIFSILLIVIQFFCCQIPEVIIRYNPYLDLCPVHS